MFRIRFPVRVEKAENHVKRIQESPEEIEILYAVSIGEVAASTVPLISMPPPMTGPRRRRVVKEITLKLDENVIDWFEERLEDGQSLDGALNKALMDHIHWVGSAREVLQEEEPAGRSGDSA